MTENVDGPRGRTPQQGTVGLTDEAVPLPPRKPAHEDSAGEVRDSLETAPLPRPKPNVSAVALAPPSGGALRLAQGETLPRMGAAERARRGFTELYALERLSPRTRDGFAPLPPRRDESYGHDLVRQLDSAFETHGNEIEPFYDDVRAIIDDLDLQALTEGDVRGALNEYLVDLGIGDPDPGAVDVPEVDDRLDEELRRLTAGVNGAHRDVLEALFFDAEVGLANSLQGYAENMAAFSTGVRELASTFLPEGEYNTFVPIVLPGLFVPAGSQVEWDGTRLVAQSPGIYALVEGDLVTVNQVSLSLSDLQNGINGNVAAFDSDGNGFAIENFQSVTAGDGSASSNTADALVYLNGGDRLVFTGFRSGHDGDRATLGVLGVDAQLGDSALSGVGVSITEDENGVRGTGSNIDLDVNGDWGLEADRVVFDRVRGEDGREAFQGLATGNVFIRLNEDYAFETDAIGVNATRDGDDSTVVFTTQGPTSGLLAGRPITASEGFVLSSNVVDGEQHSYGLRYIGDLTYDFSGDDEPSLNEPRVSGRNGIIWVEDGRLTFTGETLELDGTGDSVRGERLAAIYDTTGGRTALLRIDGWDEDTPKPPGAGEGPSTLSGEIAGYALGTSDLDHVEVEQDLETERLTRLSFAGSGLSVAPTEEALAEGDRDFDLSTEGLATVALQANDNGTFRLAEVTAEDALYDDEDWRVGINDSRSEDNGLASRLRFDERGNPVHLNASVGEGRLTSKPNDGGTPLDIRVSGGNGLDLHYTRGENDELLGVDFAANVTRGDLLSSEEGTGFVNLATADGSLHPDGSIRRVLLTADSGEYRSPEGLVGQISGGNQVLIEAPTPGEIALIQAQFSQVSVEDGDPNIDGEAVEGNNVFFQGTFGEGTEDYVLTTDAASYTGQLGNFREIGVGTLALNAQRDTVLDTTTLRGRGTGLSFSGVHGDNEEYTFNVEQSGTARLDASLTADGVETLSFGTGIIAGSALDIGTSAALFGWRDLNGFVTPDESVATLYDGYLRFNQVAEIPDVRDLDATLGMGQLLASEARTLMTLENAVANGLVRIDDEWRRAGVDLEHVQIELIHPEGSVEEIVARSGNFDGHLEGLGRLRVIMPDGEVSEASLRLGEDGQFSAASLSTGAGRIDFSHEGLSAWLRTRRSDIELVEPGHYRFSNRDTEFSGSDGPLRASGSLAVFDFQIGDDGIVLENVRDAVIRVRDENLDGLGSITLNAEVIENVRAAFGTLDERLANGERIRAIHFALDSAGDSEVTMSFVAETDFGPIRLSIDSAREVLMSGFTRRNLAQLRVDTPGGTGKIDLLGVVQASGHDRTQLQLAYEPLVIRELERDLFDISRVAFNNEDGGWMGGPNVIGFQVGGRRFRTGPVVSFGMERQFLHDPFDNAPVEPLPSDFRPHRFQDSGYNFRPDITNLHALGIATNFTLGESTDVYLFTGLAGSHFALSGTNLTLGGLDVPNDRLRLPSSPTVHGILRRENWELGAAYALSPAGLVPDNDIIDLHEPNTHTGLLHGALRLRGPLWVTGSVGAGADRNFDVQNRYLSGGLRLRGRDGLFAEATVSHTDGVKKDTDVRLNVGIDF